MYSSTFKTLALVNENIGFGQGLRNFIFASQSSHFQTHLQSLPSHLWARFWSLRSGDFGIFCIHLELLKSIHLAIQDGSLCGHHETTSAPEP